MFLVSQIAELESMSDLTYIEPLLFKFQTLLFISICPFCNCLVHEIILHSFCKNIGLYIFTFHNVIDVPYITKTSRAPRYMKIVL